MKTILILTGTGGTGKTTIIEELKLLAKENQFAMDSTTVFIGSPTRSFYQKEGMENETELESKDDQFKCDFQLRLFDYSIDHYASEYLNSTSSMLISDRCPIDMLAYTLLRSQTTMNEGRYQECINKLLDFFKLISENNVFLAELAYPAPWCSEDGFRSTAFVKNKVNSLILSDLVNTVLKEDIPNLKYNYYKPNGREDAHTRAVKIVTWK